MDAAEERRRAAYDAGLAAAQRGEEAAPGCTATPEGRAWLDGYIEGATRRAGRSDDAASARSRPGP